MTLLLDYKKLWNEGGYGKDNPFGNSMAYLKEIADQEQLHPDLMNAVVGEFFLELASGRGYPLEGCSCGCGSDKSGTAALHVVARRLMAAGDRMRERQGELIAAALNAHIIRHMERDNAEYTKAYLGDESSGSNGPLVLGLLFVALALILGLPMVF